MFSLPGRPKVGGVVDRTGPGEESEDFAGDGSFEQSQDLFLGAAFGSLVLDVAAGLWVAGHPYKRNSVKCAVGCAVTAARKPVAGGLARGCSKAPTPSLPHNTNCPITATLCPVRAAGWRLTDPLRISDSRFA